MADKSERYVSLLTRKTLALILAGGRGSRLGPLTAWRSKPAVPFGGKFRIIDFPLSNCINSGIRRVGVLTQYKAHSLIRHLHRGWSFLRGEFDEFVEILPAQQRLATSWYVGTADAIYQNIDIISAHQPEYVLILAGDHIYKMDYGPMIAYHVEHNADLTVGCLPVSIEEANAFGVMSVESGGEVREFNEKPEKPQSMPDDQGLALASMGIYVFNAQFLKEKLIADAKNPHSSRDFGKDIIPSLIKAHKVMCYPFRDAQKGTHAYWRDVGTVDAFWQANLELIGITPELNLYDENWPIWTYQEQLPPAKFVFDDDRRRGMAVDSMVSGGCIISGAQIRHSLLFSNVLVGCYSQVSNSVILPGVRIGDECTVNNAVIDRGCTIPDGMVIGKNLEEDKQRFYVSEKGVVLVTPDMLGQNWR